MAKDQDKAAPQDEALTNKVDAMMNVDQPDPVVIKPDAPADKPEIDIFKDAKGAPKLPPKLLKQIGQDAKPDTQKVEAEPASPDEPAAKEPDVQPDESKLADPETDKAVAAIVAEEGDEILAAEDNSRKKAAGTTVKTPSAWKTKLVHLVKNKWTWIGLAGLLVVLAALPWTRYPVLGLVLKGPADVIVLDSKTGTPVSNTTLVLGGATAKTDASGEAKFHAHLGNHRLVIMKQYYRDYSANFFVGFTSGGAHKVQIIATGRQVPVTLVNTITGQPLAGVELKVRGTSAKTNAQGKATVVVPTDATNDAVTASLAGFNTAQLTIQVTDKVVAANTLQLTPTGHVYFLSDLSGTLDLVKTNLDGSGRKVVLAGTGKEDLPAVSLLASRDWRFLVLESARDDGQQPALYIVDTSNDNVTKFESSHSSYNLIGWAGHDFLYDVTNLDKTNADASREAIKSYDADHGQTNIVDQNQVDASLSAYQYFNSFYLVGNELVYVDQWTRYAAFSSDISSHNDVIRGVSPTGQNKHDYNSFPSGTAYYQLELYEPAGLYFSSTSFNGGAASYYKIEDQKSTSDNSLTAADFSKPYPTFLQSPSGSQAFWSEYRDGKNTLFLGDNNAGSPKQIASLSDYAPYGWYSDKYLLASKNGSELYVLPASVPAKDTSLKATKISDYYKPQLTYQGYGGGYGGL